MHFQPLPGYCATCFWFALGEASLNPKVPTVWTNTGLWKTFQESMLPSTTANSMKDHQPLWLKYCVWYSSDARMGVCNPSTTHCGNPHLWAKYAAMSLTFSGSGNRRILGNSTFSTAEHLGHNGTQLWRQCQTDGETLLYARPFVSFHSAMVTLFGGVHTDGNKCLFSLQLMVLLINFNVKFLSL